MYAFACLKELSRERSLGLFRRSPPPSGRLVVPPPQPPPPFPFKELCRVRLLHSRRSVLARFCSPRARVFRYVPLSSRAPRSTVPRWMGVSRADSSLHFAAQIV